MCFSRGTARSEERAPARRRCGGSEGRNSEFDDEGNVEGENSLRSDERRRGEGGWKG